MSISQFDNLFSTGKNALGLAEGLNFLVEGGLADFEVLHVEVALLVKIGIGVGKLLKLDVGGLEVRFSLGLVAFGSGACLLLVHNVLVLLRNRLVGLLHEGFVGGDQQVDYAEEQGHCEQEG